MPTDKQRREAERRRLRRQLRRRAQRDARRRRFALIASIVGALVVIAIVLFFVVDTGSDHTTANQGPPTCTWTKQGTAAKQVTEPTRRPPTSGTVDVKVATNRGAMTFQLNRAAAPCAVASFVSLAGQKYYDGTPCHRLTSGSLSVLQCGDPTGPGSGGPGY